MSDYLGIRRFCELCKHSTTEKYKEKYNIICNNKDSKFSGLKVNSVLCAPCMKTKELNEEVTVETVSFD